MKLHIEIDLDNSVFHPDGFSEIVRILRKYSNSIENREGTVSRKLLDLNGNSIGFARIEK